MAQLKSVKDLSTMKTTDIVVWDPLVRICHWVLAASVIVAWFADEPLVLHTWLGYIAGAVVGVRVLWGFVGPNHALFKNFVRGPRLVFAYLFDLIRFSSKRYLGHSPAGGAMIVALLLMVAVTAGTGMATLAADRGEGPLAGIIARREQPNAPNGEHNRHEESFLKEVHEIAANITLILVVLHVAGVGLASIAHRENLVAAMISGRKRAE